MTYFHPNTKETSGPLIVTTLFGALALFSFIARLYVVHLRNALPKLEEWFVAAALFFCYVSLGLQWACVVHGGTGRHMTDVLAVNPAAVTLTLKLIIPFEALYGITIMFAKLAMLRFYERTFAISKWFRRALNFTGSCVIVWMMSVVLETFLLCRPIAYNWDTTVKGTCGNRNVVYVIAGVTNLVTDVMVLILPIPIIWKLKMPIGQKLGLTALFSLGIFITAISIVRLYALMDISFTDPTWTLPKGLMWTVLEPELAIINVNLPFLRRFFVLVAPRAFKTSSSSQGYASKTKGSKHADFRQINENGIMLQTIGGGYAYRSNITGGGVQVGLSSQADGKDGILQQRSIEVDYESQTNAETSSKAESHERIV